MKRVRRLAARVAAAVAYVVVPLGDLCACTEGSGGSGGSGGSSGGSSGGPSGGSSGSGPSGLTCIGNCDDLPLQLCVTLSAAGCPCLDGLTIDTSVVGGGGIQQCQYVGQSLFVDCLDGHVLTSVAATLHIRYNTDPPICDEIGIDGDCDGLDGWGIAKSPTELGEAPPVDWLSFSPAVGTARGWLSYTDALCPCGAGPVGMWIDILITEGPCA